MRAAISPWLLIFFLLSGGFSAELVTLPNLIEFAAEEDFPSIARQHGTFRSSISRKRNARGRKVESLYTRFLTPIIWPPDVRISRQPTASPPPNQQLHQLHQVFRI